MRLMPGDRSNHSLDSVSHSASKSHSSSTRMSIMPLVKIPLLRRTDSDEAPPVSKEPLLTMKLSSSSFLDSVISDIASEEPIYTISTTNTSTTLTRKDHRRGTARAALIKWPRVLPTKSGKDGSDGVLVQMRDARWNAGDALLKPAASSSASRKFNIPNYSQAMKWKRYGDTYWCTTASVKGPIAVMERIGRIQPTKLIIYETLHDKYDPKALSAIQGVSILLLDYIVVTALLLVTDLQEWMLVKKVEDPNGADGEATSSVPNLGASRLRKIVYGEPMFPHRTIAESRSKHSSSSTGPMTSAPQTPTTPNFGSSTYNYESSFCASSRPASLRAGHSLASIASHDETNDSESFMIPPDIQLSSPIAESVRHSRFASHSHFDPSFYGPAKEPPVPPLPYKYARSLHAGSSARPPSPLAESFTQEFGQLRISSEQQRVLTTLNEHTPLRDAGPVRAERSNSIKSFASSSGGRRPLPKPPQAASILAPASAARRVQSSAQLRSHDASSSSSPSLTSTSHAEGGTVLVLPRPQRSLPTTPGGSAISDATFPSAVSENDTVSSSGTPSQLLVDTHHSRIPPIAKSSQEDLTNWVHLLTSPQRDLPPAPLPDTSIYDVPPPAYDTINFSRARTQRRGGTRRRDPIE